MNSLVGVAYCSDILICVINFKTLLWKKKKLKLIADYDQWNKVNEWGKEVVKAFHNTRIFFHLLWLISIPPLCFNSLFLMPYPSMFLSSISNSSCFILLLQCQFSDGQWRHSCIFGGSGRSSGGAQVPSLGGGRLVVCEGQGWDGTHPCSRPNGMPVLSEMDGKSY
jgi:hypothetical protein